jgi:hypothetical protein
VQNHLGASCARRLVGALARGASDGFVLVGHDESVGHASAAELAAQLRTPVFALARPARRGYFSMVAPYFQALDWLARERIDYDWLIYLSGQDYPTQPIAALERRLATHGFDGYIRHWRADSAANPWRRRRQGFLRYRLQYYEMPAAARPLLRLLKLLNGVQTLLMAADGFRLCDDDLRFVDFAGSRDGHPRTLDERDLPALADPRYFFARKFDPVADPRPLDRLDERLA